MRPALALVVGLLVATCGGETTDATDGPEADPVTTTTVAAPVDTAVSEPGGAIGTADTSLGKVLVDDNGLTLYIFGVDEGGESACYGECETNWPPVTAGLSTGDGIDVTVGATTRTDGSEQLTVNGRPVYLYARDSKPGDVNGHGLNDVWFAVDVNGDPFGVAVEGALEDEPAKQGGYDY